MLPRYCAEAHKGAVEGRGGGGRRRMKKKQKKKKRGPKKNKEKKTDIFRSI